MTLYSASSGDTIADRRADYAEMLLRSGDEAAAADLMLQALERAPAWTYGWFRLGEMHEACGQADAAAKAFATALDLDPDDRLGASLKLHLAGAGPSPETMPPAFVETLFDQYAATFDTALVDRLDYRAPALLLDAIVAAQPGRFAQAVDLGCGTGLMGELLRPRCDRLDGYDISEGMLREARAKDLYDQLEKADLSTLRLEAPVADLAVAADVYMYLGALGAPFVNVRTMLRPGGLFAFSVERLDAPGFALRETRRYAHSRDYVEETLARAGFRVERLAEATIRKDREAPVAGLIVLARQPEPGQ